MNEETLLAYKLGMDMAARSSDYANFEEFAKEAAGIVGTVGNAAKYLGTRGALVGAGVGAAGGLMSGPSDQSFGDRAMRGLGGAAIGAGVGGGLGALGGAAGQRAYLSHMGSQMKGTSAAATAARGSFKENPMFWNKPMQGASTWANQQLGAAKNWAWGPK